MNKEKDAGNGFLNRKSKSSIFGVIFVEISLTKTGGLFQQLDKTAV